MGLGERSHHICTEHTENREQSALGTVNIHPSTFDEATIMQHTEHLLSFRGSYRSFSYLIIQVGFTVLVF